MSRNRGLARRIGVAFRAWAASAYRLAAVPYEKRPCTSGSIAPEDVSPDIGSSQASPRHPE